MDGFIFLHSVFEYISGIYCIKDGRLSVPSCNSSTLSCLTKQTILSV